MSNSRSVATDALATLGTILDEHQKRDAIHLAVEPTIAGRMLEPGDHIVIRDGIAERVPVGKGQGIVDPFLEGYIKKGERFWFVMYPRKVTSLRHVWACDGFPDEAGTPAAPPAVTAPVGLLTAQKKTSIRWIDDFAARLDVTYDELMVATAAWLTHGDVWCEGGRFEGSYLSDDFWPHYEIVTGLKVPKGEQQSFFSCSC